MGKAFVQKTISACFLVGNSLHVSFIPSHIRRYLLLNIKAFWCDGNSELPGYPLSTNRLH